MVAGVISVISCCNVSPVCVFDDYTLWQSVKILDYITKEGHFYVEITGRVRQYFFYWNI